MSLLTPHDRSMLLSNLRPPPGFRLDTALGTTFSLDLLALMVAPVGFTLFDVDPNDPTISEQDTFELLEAIRRHASKIVLFCQAGRIAVPRHHRPLLTYLEERIVSANAPTKQHSFHPKVWMIRYVNDDGDVRYRLLCLSRNLTFDRSWDTILTLDGELRADREREIGVNAGLSDFVAALPKMAVGGASGVAPGLRTQIRTIENEIGRVEWDMEGLPFETLSFWPLGHDGRTRWPFRERRDRMLVVSPFLTGGTLAKLVTASGDDVLISRSDSLDALAGSEALDRYSQVYQLSTRGAILDPDVVEAEVVQESAGQGLHAKLYIADDGWNARVWTGSANATAAAFGGNVEFLVELGGKRSQVGVEAFLEKIQGAANFRDLLTPYEAPDVECANAELEELKKELDDLRSPLASAQWAFTVSAGAALDEFVPIARTQNKLPRWPDHVTVSCRPLTLSDAFALPLIAGESAEASFGAVALESLTAFLVVRIEGKRDANKYAVEFVIPAPLLGAPENRKERILRSMIQSREALVRFLLALLSDDMDTTMTLGNGQSQGWRGSGHQSDSGYPLFEPLLRTLSRNPGKLTTVKSLLGDLATTEEGAALVPDGLQELFDVVFSAKPTGSP